MLQQLNLMVTITTDLYIYGASGHGKVVLDAALRLGMLVTGFLDDNPALNLFEGLPVVQTLSRKQTYIIAIGDNKIRKKLAVQLQQQLINALVHPTATIAHNSALGKGTFVAANVVINPNCIIGINCIINTSAVIEHDCMIGDHVHVSPNATLCGAVSVGSGTHVGAAAVILPGVSIGSGCVIGAGSVVIKNVPDGATVVGNPARVIKK
jgi:acetyltransferase EpsM